VGWTNVGWEDHSWEKEAAASALFVFLRHRDGSYSSHTNFKPQPQISSSEMLMKPSDNSHHKTSANCPIEVIHRSVQVKSRRFFHLHQAHRRPPDAASTSGI
jgi:hypothetical protein